MSPTTYVADPVYGIEPVDITPTSWEPLEIRPTTRGRNFRRLVTTAMAVTAGAGVMVALSLLGGSDEAAPLGAELAGAA